MEAMEVIEILVVMRMVRMDLMARQEMVELVQDPGAMVPMVTAVIFLDVMQIPGLDLPELLVAMGPME